jgi:AcrR family transcriptional regulator
MPRISAATIAEHVAQQEAAVLEAARRLFAERGVAAVSIADIAAEVGLQRTSLYRYFPTKGHILQRWFDQAMTPLVERSRAIAELNEPARERLEQWLDVQLDFVTDDSHASLVTATEGIDDLPDEVRADFADRHRELYETLEPLLRAGGTRGTEVTRARAVLIAGLVRSAGELSRQGAPRATVRRELHRSAAAVAGL